MATKGAQVGAQESGRESVLGAFHCAGRLQLGLLCTVLGGLVGLSLSLSRSLYRSLLCAQRCLQEQIQIYCEAVVVPKRRVAVSGA